MAAIMLRKLAEKDEDIKEALHSFYWMDGLVDHSFPYSPHRGGPGGAVGQGSPLYRLFFYGALVLCFFSHTIQENRYLCGAFRLLLWGAHRVGPVHCAAQGWLVQGLSGQFFGNTLFLCPVSGIVGKV